jgi:leader peptidase (prepilin peptidase)/N-methyltransferase
MLSILSFIFGASIGSFSQVVASRFHVAPITKGRSKCLTCGETLHVMDLIPIISFLLLKGKCRYCKSSYGISALIVEVLFGVTFLLLYKIVIVGQPSLFVSMLWLIYYTVLFSVLGIMALYDKAHSYIPVQFLSVFLVLTSGMQFLRFIDTPTIATLISPMLVALPFLLIWLITKGKGLGFGDVIPFFGVGQFFGVLQGGAVLIVSVWLGALFGIYLKIISKKRGLTAMPFVPFIVVAFLIVLFSDIDVFSLFQLFMFM